MQQDVDSDLLCGPDECRLQNPIVFLKAAQQPPTITHPSKGLIGPPVSSSGIQGTSQSKYFGATNTEELEHLLAPARKGATDAWRKFNRPNGWAMLGASIVFSCSSNVDSVYYDALPV